ncbi:hypothetical protein GCM10010145_12720 [Streptomyces ruber]|uniref:Histidine kinase/HSP90-like ATPase domain-containing protein n=2 Tax=Streptomyces TaxID=1883 RepID=A0A918BAP9_9ACTN|nr:ATP-binding protein [Streptomyces ruber]GGQ45488.1 hypothetical protein GCM10010145_12720 [Streptomyces ruber]
MATPFLPQPSGRLTGGPRSSSADRPHEVSPLPALPAQAPKPRFPAGASGPVRSSAPHSDPHPAPRSSHRTAAFDLSATPSSVAAARRTVRVLLEAWGVDDDTGDNAVLVVSELVTNALTHTGSVRIVCRLSWTGRRLRVEVEDQNGGGPLPLRREPGDDDQHGRGLLLVGALSRDWGVRDTACGSGRVVWAEPASGDCEKAEEPEEREGPEAGESSSSGSGAPSPGGPSSAVVRRAPAPALPVRAVELPSREVALWSKGDQVPPWEATAPSRPVAPAPRPGRTAPHPATGGPLSHGPAVHP